MFRRLEVRRACSKSAGGVCPRKVAHCPLRLGGAAAIPLVLAIFLAACRPSPPAPPQAPAATPPVIRAFTQFSPGDTLELVQIQLGLSGYEVRYRSSMPPDQMGMVYFLDEGNLHIDVKKIGDTWVLITVPFLEPSTIPAADRVADWDRGADSQNRRSASQR